jgi:hypothetical protein
MTQKWQNVSLLISMHMRVHDQSNFEEFVRTTQIMTDRDFFRNMSASKESTCSACWKLEWPDLTDGGSRIRDIYRDHTVPMRARGNPRASEFYHFPAVYVTRRLVENVVCRGWFESIKYIVCDCSINIQNLVCECGHGAHVTRPSIRDEEVTLSVYDQVSSI